MYVKLVIGKQIINIVSAYAPQVGLSAEEKDDFWDSFIIVLSGIPKQESIFIGSDMNGHVGRDADGYGGVHGGMGFGTRNAEGERILEFGDAVVRKKKSQWANGPMLTQINGPFQISMGHGIKCMGHQWVSISKPV